MYSYPPICGLPREVLDDNPVARSGSGVPARTVAAAVGVAPPLLLRAVALDADSLSAQRAAVHLANGLCGGGSVLEMGF